MASLARIFYAKSDGSTMDNKINGALSIDAVVDFLDETAHLRTADIEKVQFSHDGYISYDRNAGFVRKSVTWNIEPTEQTTGFLAPSPELGYCCTTLARCHVEDRERAVSRNGYRILTIPAPIETIEEHESDIQLAVRRLFLCHTLVLAKIAFLSTRNNFFG
jgi:hypothetical protein